MKKIILFKKPKWLKPEVNDLVYWIHLGIIAVTVLGILQLWKGGNMLTINTVLISIPLLAIGDVIGHTSLGLD